ncbi:hypothetical protein C8J56DRAFT_903950 [Mycena floridula]|nr:hypothetical protein C8J56DRAFT_903950 [Mycena floridula]
MTLAVRHCSPALASVSVLLSRGKTRQSSRISRQTQHPGEELDNNDDQGAPSAKIRAKASRKVPKSKEFVDDSNDDKHLVQEKTPNPRRCRNNQISDEETPALKTKRKSKSGPSSSQPLAKKSKPIKSEQVQAQDPFESEWVRKHNLNFGMFDGRGDKAVPTDGSGATPFNFQPPPPPMTSPAATTPSSSTPVVATTSQPIICPQASEPKESPLIPPIAAITTPVSPASSTTEKPKRRKRAKSKEISQPRKTPLVTPSAAPGVSPAARVIASSSSTPEASAVPFLDPISEEVISKAFAAVLAHGGFGDENLTPPSQTSESFEEGDPEDLVHCAETSTPGPAPTPIAPSEPNVDFLPMTGPPIPQTNVGDSTSQAPASTSASAADVQTASFGIFSFQDLRIGVQSLTPTIGVVNDDWMPQLGQWKTPTDAIHHCNRHIIGTLSESFFTGPSPAEERLDQLSLGADDRNYWMHPALNEFKVFFKLTKPEDDWMSSIVRLSQLFAAHNILLVGGYSYQLDFSETPFALELRSAIEALVTKRGLTAKDLPASYLEVIAGPTLKEPSKVVLEDLFRPLNVDFGDERRTERVLGFHRGLVYHRPLVTLADGTELMGGPTADISDEQFFGLHPFANSRLKLGAEAARASKGKGRAVHNRSPDHLHLLVPAPEPEPDLRQIHQPRDSGSRWDHLTAPPGSGARFHPLGPKSKALDLDGPPAPGYTSAPRPNVGIIVVPERHELQMLRDSPPVSTVPPCLACISLRLTCQPSQTLGQACRHCHSQNRNLCSHKIWLGDFDAIRTELHSATAPNMKALGDRMPVLERVRARLVTLDNLNRDCLMEYEELRTEWLRLFIEYAHTPGGPEALSIIPRAHYEEILMPLFAEAQLDIVNEKLRLAYSSVWLEGQGFPEPSRDGVERIPIILSSEASAEPPVDAVDFKFPPSYAEMAAKASKAMAEAGKSSSKSKAPTPKAPAPPKAKAPPKATAETAQKPVAKVSALARVKPKPSGSKSAKAAVPAVVESEDGNSEDETSDESPPRPSLGRATKLVIEDEESEEDETLHPRKRRRVESESESEASLPPAKSKNAPTKTTAAATTSKTKSPGKVAKSKPKPKPITMEAGDHSRRQRLGNKAGGLEKPKRR